MSAPLLFGPSEGASKTWTEAVPGGALKTNKPLFLDKIKWPLEFLFFQHSPSDASVLNVHTKYLQGR